MTTLMHVHVHVPSTNRIIPSLIELFFLSALGNVGATTVNQYRHTSLVAGVVRSSLVCTRNFDLQSPCYLGILNQHIASVMCVWLESSLSKDELSWLLGWQDGKILSHGCVKDILWLSVCNSKATSE